MDGNFGLRAEDAAPRGFAPSDSGRPIRVRPRREVRLAGLALCPLRCSPPQRSDPSLNNQTCSLRAKPACCDFASFALRISQHRSARSKRTPRYRLCTIFGASDPLGIISQGIRAGLEPLRKEARLFGPALCQLFSNPAEEPTQASTNRHSHASLQSACQPRALHKTRIASRTARACLGTAQHFFFLVLQTCPDLGPRAGILE